MHLDPVLIKVMMPEVAFVTIGGVVLPAINAARGVWAWHAFSRGGDGRGRFSIALAAPRESAMVLMSVRTYAEGSLRLKRLEC